MSVPRSVAEILGKHVNLEVQRIDRMYLNVYVPELRSERGVVAFLRCHRGHPFASSALMEPIGKAQEKTRVFRTEKRKNPRTGQRYPWIARATALVNHYYLYCVDREVGPFFLKFCSHFPYTATAASTGMST